MQETFEELEQQSLPGEQQRLKTALLTDQAGILTATRQRLARIARARGVESAAIDDVVQETLLEAWSHLDRLTAPSGFHLWIDEICRNICRRYAHRQQNNLLRSIPGDFQGHEFIAEENDTSSLANLLDPSVSDPVEIISQHELELLLDHALGYLPLEARQMVEMCHLLELPHSEVAQRLGISVGALDTRLHRVRRQLRAVLSGPLYQEAASFGLVEEQENNGGWFETSVWCSRCGQHRLQGSFFEASAGSVNLHARCPGCSQIYGLDTVHSMGLVELGKLRSFRPAWKRTMQGLSALVLQALHSDNYPCPWCGHPTSIQMVDAEAEENASPAGPYPFWIRWSCSHCGDDICSCGDWPSADQVVCWSHARTRQFMTQHPRWLSTPGPVLEVAGQPALRFQISDRESAAHMTVLAHRDTLRVLAIY